MVHRPRTENEFYSWRQEIQWGPLGEGVIHPETEKSIAFKWSYFPGLYKMTNFQENMIKCVKDSFSIEILLWKF